MIFSQYLEEARMRYDETIKTADAAAKAVHKAAYIVAHDRWNRTWKNSPSALFAANITRAAALAAADDERDATRKAARRAANAVWNTLSSTEEFKRESAIEDAAFAEATSQADAAWGIVEHALRVSNYS
jgi:hypothetical protein